MTTGGRWDRYDESDARIRPGRGSRPRSKLRPAHADAVPGTVVTVDRGRYTCVLTGDGSPLGDTPAGTALAGAPDGGDQQVVATRARELGRRAVVVGDSVGLVGDTTGDDGSLARIVRVHPRRTTLRRTADDDDPVERVVVANADQLLVVAAVADPAPQTRLIDRCVVAALDAGLQPTLCLTKTDLADPAALVATYADLGVTVLLVGGLPGPADLTQVREQLRGRVTALVGSSGVGKSTLVNALVPDAHRSIGGVNAVTGRGRHTSTSAYALRLDDGGWVVDTPGIRSFGLAHVDPRSLVQAFPDLAAVVVDCPRRCTHAGTEPECAIDAAVAAGTLPEERAASFRRLLASREGETGD